MLIDLTERIPSGVRTFYGPRATQGIMLIVQNPPEPNATEPDEGDSIGIFFGRHGDNETNALFFYQVTDTPHLAPFNAAMRAIADILPGKLAQELLKFRDHPDTDLLFADYYEQRAKGEKTTLGDLAEQYGYNPSYLRRLKVDYDRRTGRKR